LGRQLVRLLTTTDHKTIGKLYLVTSFTWFLIGGILALLIRSELAFPGQQIVNDELYNQAAADAKTSVFDSAHPLGQELLDDAVAEQRGARLAALDRASECLRAGTYGVS
jgi:hypothetical protein